MKSRENGKWKVLFFLYVLLLLRLIVFKYPYARAAELLGHWQREAIREGFERANFTLLKTIRMYIRYYDRLNSFENLFGNLLLFVPYGLLYPLAFPGKRSGWLFLPILFAFVLGIELFQLCSTLGAFDVDDILLNCIGAALGGIFMIAVRHGKW